MPKMLPDGTIISSNIPVSEQKDYSNMQNYKDYGIYKAVILDTYPIDHEKNRSKLAVEYLIQIEDGDKNGHQYTGARMFNTFGGAVNFSEMVLQKQESPVFDTTLNIINKDPTDWNNSYVLVAFMGGYSVPIIIANWQHPNCKKPFAKEEDGIRLLAEFNGVRWNINKDGELILTYLGGPRTPVPGPKQAVWPLASNLSTAPTQIKIDKSGGVTVIDNEQQEVKISREDQTISIKQYFGILPPETKFDYDNGYEAEPLPGTFPINEVTIDKANKKISAINYETGGIESLKFEIDGSAGLINLEDVLTKAKIEMGSTKITGETGAGTIFSIDGSSDEISSKTVVGDEITASSSSGILAKTATGSTCKLANGMVGLGGPAGELVEEFEKLLTQMDTLLTAMQSETHTGNLGYPTSPPLNAAAYAAVQAQVAAIKVIIGLIKGGI